MFSSHLGIQILGVFTIYHKPEMSGWDNAGMDRSYLYFSKSFTFHLCKHIRVFMLNHRFSFFPFGEVGVWVEMQSQRIVVRIFCRLPIKIIDLVLLHKGIVVDITDLRQSFLITLDIRIKFLFGIFLHDDKYFIIICRILTQKHS